MRHLHGRSRLLGLVALSGLLGACVSSRAGGSVTPSAAPSSALAGAATTQQTSPDCYAGDESVDGPPATVANLMPYSSIVVVADVESLEPGIWNTKDGQPPARGFKPGPTFDPQVETPVNLQVDDTWFGDAGPGALRIVNPGGTAGCAELHVNNAADLQKGRRYVFFLEPSPDADGQRHPELPIVLEAWPVGDTGQVATADEGSISLAQLEALVHHPVAPAATPEPTPAGSDHPG